MNHIDMRSDTVTEATPEMREAMAKAKTGDDMFRGDPTVNELQRLAAETTGFEDAIFVPSGVMGNQIALWVHSGRSGQVICDAHSHIAHYEGGAAAMLSGVTLNTVNTKDGIIKPGHVAPRIFPDDQHFARTKLIEIENTHNWAGGVVWKQQELRDIYDYAAQIKVPVHVDGARIFNAAVAQNANVSELLDGASSVMFCLSKGLSAPIGSMLCGSKKFIEEGRRVRKVLGGAMRQSGHLAAAGILAMQDGPAQLKKDHEHARLLASELEKIRGFQVQPQRPRTNMIYVDIAKTGLDAEEFIEVMQEAKIGCLGRDNGTMVRFVTHRHISKADTLEAARRIQEIFADL